MQHRFRFSCYLLAFASLAVSRHVAIADKPAASTVTIRDVGKRLIGEWHPDLELTTEYVRERLNDDTIDVSQGPMWRYRSTVAWTFREREMSQTTIGKPDDRLRGAPYILAADAKGAFYIIPIKDSGRYDDGYRIEFYKDALVLLMRVDSAGHDCLVFRKVADRKPTKNAD